MSAECWTWSAPTSQQPREAHVQTRRLRCKGVGPLFQATQGGPRPWEAPWPRPMACLVLCQRDTDAHRIPQHGAEWGEGGGCKAGGVLAWALQHLVSSGPGLRPALAWRSRRRPHLGSQPESASSLGNSHLPPLPGLSPASTHIPTQGSSPTLQIS